MQTDGAPIREFLAQHRLALVGASRDPKDFSRAVLRELVARGYDVVPVNPAGGEVDGQRVYARVQDVQGGVGGALVMTPSTASADVVRDCIDAGVPRVWLHRGAGQGAVSDEAVHLARSAGLSLVAGECPLMYLEGAGLVHRLHGATRRLGGSWPLPVPRPPRGPSIALGLAELFVALGAIPAGAIILWDPTGAKIGLPALTGPVFHSYLVPGLVLLGINGFGSLAAAIGAFARTSWAAVAGMVLGAFLVAWIAVQVAVIGPSSWMQPLMLAVGLTEMALGIAMRRMHVDAEPRTSA